MLVICSCDSLDILLSPSSIRPGGRTDTGRTHSLMTRRWKPFFTKKSNSSHGSSITTQVAWERNMFYQSRLSLILVTNNSRLPPRPLNPLRSHSPSSLTLQRNAAAWTCEMLNLMLAGAAMWQEVFFMYLSQSPPYHVFASNCQNNMQGQSSVVPRKHVHTVPSVNKLF